MSGSAVFTCITCHVAFSDGEVQREHYKSDWHRYNLKRKVAELPHVTAERFRERVLAQQSQQPPPGPGDGALYCQPCKKPFRSAAQHQNHVQSRKHQEQQRRWETDEVARRHRQLEAEQNNKNSELSGLSEKQPGASSRPAPAVTVADAGDSDSDSSVEEVDSDEWAEEGGIPPTDCLFCAHASPQLAGNMRHMTQAHSFFVPDVEFVTDLEGLVTYLGQKVGEGFICLWCNERGRHFHSAEAVQKHMRDKGHTKMLHEGEALAEYADFYDYSRSYPEGEEESEGMSEPPDLDTGAYQLVLPSGAVVGHRALARYYRQQLRPEKAVALRRTGGATSSRDILHQYRLMGWTGSNREQLKRTARDMMALRKHQTKDRMQLGMKANKLQHHFRQQNPI